MSTGKYKSVKLKYKDVISLLEQCDCTFMWSEDKFNNEYVNSKKTKMKYKGYCGHEWEGSWSSVRKKLVMKKVLCTACGCQKGKWERYDKEHYNEETGEYQCSKCNEWKDLKTNFGKAGHNGRAKNGRRNYCQSCAWLATKNRQQNWTEDEFINNYLIYNAEARHICKEKNGTKYNEKCNITYKDIVELKEKQNNKCKYTGVDLIWKVGSGMYQTSIDRIDSNKTYTKDNIQLVCFWANQAKSNGDETEFLKFIEVAFNYSCKK